MIFPRFALHQGHGDAAILAVEGTFRATFEGRPGDLDWPETRPLCDGDQAFADIRQGRVAGPKIFLIP
ncbi:hypothetical protein SAMN05421751_10454 [Jhaorihella thermophila]|uniref:Uncharacterized protein n=1 Tax=Jhaorihella thermophila TaxID=488547 RepID=A0A1H5UGS2_9RHOB|nr:hypothetical protein SAMN05421751_10454 [Jhaorihella thermophila]